MIRTRYFTAGLLVGLLLLTVGLGRAHRLSGHPHSLAGKLALAKAQVRHDKASGDPWLQRDKRYVRQLRRLLHPPVGPAWMVRAFLCIHRGEGAWNDSGDPYWGGLQMDRGFMFTYGSREIRRYGGFANRWPPMVQIQVAIRAHQSGRGFYPWPTTARRCGLI